MAISCVCYDPVILLMNYLDCFMCLYLDEILLIFSFSLIIMNLEILNMLIEFFFEFTRFVVVTRTFFVYTSPFKNYLHLANKLKFLQTQISIASSLFNPLYCISKLVCLEKYIIGEIKGYVYY